MNGLNRPMLIASAASVLTAQAAVAAPVQVTDVRVRSGDGTLSLILETAAAETVPQSFKTQYGQTLAIDLIGTQLALADGKSFQRKRPTAGVASIAIEQRNANSTRITIHGTEGIPEAKLNAQNGTLALAVSPPSVTAQASTSTEGTKSFSDASPAQSQQQAQQQQEPIELIVTPTRTERKPQKVPQSVTVITREEVEQQASLSRDLGDILAQTVPGFAPSTQTSSNFGQTLRGRNPSVLIDGIPQGTTRDVQRDLRTIDPNAIQRIEVVRGASAIYGSQATGGIVNIITRPPSEAPQSELSVGIDNSLTHVSESFGTEVQYSFSGQKDDFNYRVNASYDETGAFFDAEGDRIPPDPQGQGGNAQTRTLNLLGKFGVELSNEQRLQLTVNHFNDQQQSRFARDPNPSGNKAEAIEGLQLPEQPENVNTVLSLNYTHDDLLGSQVDAKLYYRDYLSRFYPGNFGRQVFQSRLESETFGSRLDVTTPLSDSGNVRLVWGFDYSNEDGRQQAELFDHGAFNRSNQRVFEPTGETAFFAPSYEQSELGTFAKLNWDMSDRLTLNGGIRHERIGIDIPAQNLLFGSIAQGGHLDYSETLSNVGAVYELSGSASAFANFSQGFSAIDVPDLFRFSSNVDVERRNPEARKVDSYEIGLRGDWEDVQASISAFYTFSELGESFGAAPAFRIQRSPTRIYGLEGNANTQLGQNWQLGGTATWIQGEEDPDDDEEFTDSLPVTRIPPLKLTAYVENETLPGWRNRFQLLYSGVRNPKGTGFGLGETNSYVTLDLISRIDLGTGSLKVSVENLLNEQFFPIASQAYAASSNFGAARNGAGRGRRLSINYSISW